MKTNLIAFSGLAGSGKSTAADVVGQLRFGVRPVHRVSFAAPIRAMLRGLGLTEHDLTVGKLTPHPLLCGKTPREAMQTLGTQWGREMIARDLWINAARMDIIAWRLERTNLLVVIDDCRFPNEAEMVRELGGMVVLIVRPGVETMDHASERGLPPELIDATIQNDVDLATFTGRVRAVMGI